jgi:hypothetical protein
MKDDGQPAAEQRLPWVKPTIVEEDCAATESGAPNPFSFDGEFYYS